MQQGDIFNAVAHMDLEFLSRSLHSYLVSRCSTRPDVDGVSSMITCSSYAQTNSELDVLEIQSMVISLNALSEELEVRFPLPSPSYLHTLHAKIVSLAKQSKNIRKGHTTAKAIHGGHSLTHYIGLQLLVGKQKLLPEMIGIGFSDGGAPL